MKKAILIIVFGLLWCNVSFADESELYIEIERATQETDILKINEGYKYRCEETYDDYEVIYNASVIKSNVLKSEAVANFGEEGEIYFKITRKISSSGKISKAKVKVHYSPDFNKDFKKIMKKFMKEFKDSMGSDYIATELYGQTLKPIKIEDKKAIKEAKRNLQKILKLMPDISPDMNDFIKQFKKIKIISGYRQYLGTSVIQSEKFYVLKSSVTFEHPDENFIAELSDVLDGDTLTGYVLFHAASGYSIAMDGQRYPICTIYKQDKELVKIDTSDIF
jgi:hypothetical protein